jgi:rare lipoprotein A
MANGNRFDYRKPTAATWGIPLGTMVQITNLGNGKSVIVEITDRGPAHSLHRVADLSQAAAEQLDYIQQGTATVLIQVIVDVEPESAVLEADLIELESPLALEAVSLAVSPISGRD